MASLRPVASAPRGASSADTFGLVVAILATGDLCSLTFSWGPVAAFPAALGGPRSLPRGPP
eukprot:3514751-Lingulodinium_polyedra.AAC.1